MSTIKREAIRSSITHKDFREDPNKNNPDHDFYYFYLNNKRTHIWIKLSRGSDYKTYNDTLLGRQAKIMGIPLGDLKKFIECTYNSEKLTEILITNKKIDPNKIGN